MCGIAGVMCFHGQAPDLQALSDMIESARHRGPDDVDLQINGSVGLAHARLSIIDLDARSRQPMSYGDRYWIVYNGEVYNYIELREELKRAGHCFRTTSDTEVILAAYAQWGAGCLSRFNGMWAFAILDTLEQEVFFARDRFGVKPLMLAWQSGALYFSSEIKQLLAVSTTRKANARRVLDYLVTGYENHTNETFFEGIETLPAGSWMRVACDGRVLGHQTFFTLTERPEYARMGFEEAAEAVSNLLHDSIRLRLRSDVRVGTCISGGVDSALISRIASGIYSLSSRERFLGIHAKSIEHATDESEFARKVADHANIQLAIVEPSTEDFVATIDEVVYTQEEPFGGPSMFMGWHVFQEAKRRGCSVMLNGQGCDEAFLGYERYYPLELDSAHPVDFVRRLWLQSANSKLSMSEALGYYLYFRHAFLRISRLKANRYVARPRMAMMAFDSVRESADCYTRCFAMQKLEIESLQLPHLLRYEDRNSMRHSIETRLPFLDYRLMEAGASISLKHKLHAGWTKYVVRKVAKHHLLEEIAWRKDKLGFEAPTRVWLRDRTEQIRREIESSPLVAEFADMANIRRDFDRMSERQIWVFFNLAVWARVYGVSA